ncbi:hypothetical protein [Azospirillum sp.]|uniref:hypothetical protein n=1 Tax=Azospirillum sp. TaxID=34012 RepID=UPI002D72CEED|nr:hypothetical protein [Azospirillum sp.]HYF90093.1 hypothetical protein [Azospirillum sp.]
MEVAYPYVDVTVDLKGLTPVAVREPGVVAVVGMANAGPDETPTVVDSIKGVKETFGDGGDLSPSLQLVLAQRPAASRVYGLKVKNDDEGGWRYAFSVLEGVKDVTFVGAANRPIRQLAAGTLDVVALLKKHCEDASNDGSARIAVSYIDPAIGRPGGKTYADAVVPLADNYKSDQGRMIVFAARGATVDGGAKADVAAAGMSLIAGLRPETSILLKQVLGLRLAPKEQFSSKEIKDLAAQRIVPIIDPPFIPGGSLHLGEGTTLTDNDILAYVDVVRLLDDMTYSLKANLIGLIGDARITRSGLYAVQRTLEGVLDGYVLRQAITSYRILIDLLQILEKPEGTWTQNERQRVSAARNARNVAIEVLVVIGPAIHKIVVALKPTYAMPEATA